MKICGFKNLWAAGVTKSLGAAFLVWMFSTAPCGFAAVPSAEKLLPDDTLFVITTPDFPRLRATFDQLPLARLWDDPLLKPFRDNFVSKWTNDIVKPLERDLNMDIGEYADLAQGQLTVALTRGGQGSDGKSRDLIVLVDTKDKGSQLNSKLALLRKKWIERDKIVRTEKIRDAEFLLVSLATNDAPRTFKQFFPHAPEVQELGSATEPQKPPPKAELVIGHVDSLLIVSSSLKAAEKIVAHLTGSGAPALGDLAAYQTHQVALFRDAPLYAWLNVKGINELPDRKGTEPKNSAVPDPFPAIAQDKYLSASGLMGVKAIAWSFHNSSEGMLMQMNLSAPESNRQSLFKLPPTEPRDCGIPPFVPADAVGFKRWRLDGQKAWAAFEKFLADTSPQALSGITAILDLANANARQKDPSFDVRRNLIGNLGDDLISYKKVPRSLAPNDLDSPPAISLISSPNPDQFVAGLQSILIFISAQAEKPAEREFLGRKILSVPLPPLALPFIETKPRPPRTIHYAASAGYVALSTDASILEEFLRRSENQGRSLRESPGLTEAAQKVLGPGTISFGFENQAETFRGKFEEWKFQATAATNPPLPNLPTAPFGPTNPEKSISDWMDFSLLPPFDSVSKYFHFSVHGVSAGVDGFTFKYFLAAPPPVKASVSAAAR
jgi:hypothetical protein